MEDLYVSSDVRMHYRKSAGNFNGIFWATRFAVTRVHCDGDPTVYEATSLLHKKVSVLAALPKKSELPKN